MKFELIFQGGNPFLKFSKPEMLVPASPQEVFLWELVMELLKDKRGESNKVDDMLKEFYE